MLYRDMIYQGDRAYAISMEKVSFTAGTQSDLWFRYCDAGDPDGLQWTCKLYATRAEAVADPLGPPLATTDSYVKAVYTHPLPLTLTFTNGVTAEIHDIGAQPNPWLGEVFAYIYPSGNGVIDHIVSTLQAHTGDGQALDGIALVRQDPNTEAMPGLLPCLDVHAESFDLVVPVEVKESQSRWRGRFGIRVRLTSSVMVDWWRAHKQQLAAVLSILADENARAIQGCESLYPAGGDPSRDGVGVLRFTADVVGVYES